MFFQQHIRSIPTVNPNFWSFSIGGKVCQPLILSYADLQALTAQTLRCVVVCAGTNHDQPLIGEGLWRGVPLQALLDELTIAPDARYARISAADGYTTVLPIDKLAQTLLVYALDNAPLPLEHGYPARLIASGLHGYKMPKWVERIELTDATDGGFWESRGWSLEGTVGVKAAITGHEQTADGTVTLSGVAYASNLTALEISVDGGGWMPIPLAKGSTLTLTRWRINWIASGAGDYQVCVRASDGHAEDQHSLVVRIR